MPSDFQKGGIHPKDHVLIAILMTVISMMLAWCFNSFDMLERILIALPVSFLSLFFTSLIFTPIIIHLLDEDKTWYFWREPHRLAINSIYYGLNAFFISDMLNAYFLARSFSRLSHSPERVI